MPHERSIKCPTCEKTIIVEDETGTYCECSYGPIIIERGNVGKKGFRIILPEDLD